MKRRKPDRLHFGGLWITEEEEFARFEARGELIIPTVLFFLGEDFLLVTRVTYEGDRVTNLDHTSFIYDAEPGRLKVWLVTNSPKRPKAPGAPKILQWRLVGRRFLELNEKGDWLRYSPTSLDELESLGIPKVYFETWIDVFEKQLDSFVILRPLAPDFGGGAESG
jgi:hypothetical protein